MKWRGRCSPEISNQPCEARRGHTSEVARSLTHPGEAFHVRQSRRLNCTTRLVVIRRGPYPEHGVGWEAGMYASYFAQCRMVAFGSDIPGRNGRPPGSAGKYLLTVICNLRSRTSVPFRLTQSFCSALTITRIRRFYRGSPALRTHLPVRSDFGPRSRRGGNPIVKSGQQPLSERDLRTNGGATLAAERSIGIFPASIAIPRLLLTCPVSQT